MAAFTGLVAGVAFAVIGFSVEILVFLGAEVEEASVGADLLTIVEAIKGCIWLMVDTESKQEAEARPKESANFGRKKVRLGSRDLSLSLVRRAIDRKSRLLLAPPLAQLISELIISPSPLLLLRYCCQHVQYHSNIRSSRGTRI